ncbi:MAG: amidase family protein, partial [Phenylobacterium sp.]|nr:amidase family protein [Phenylobacterium sp.]
GARGLRLAASPPERLGPLDPDVARLYRAALERLGEAGFVLVETPPPPMLEESFTPNGLLMAGEGWRIWGDRILAKADDMDPWIVRRFQAGRDISDEQLARIHLDRLASQAAFQNWMADFDGVVSPTCPIPASALADVDETVSPLSRLTRAANYLDLPGISVPCGLTRDGLPVGLQITGRTGDEATVIAIGAAFERISGWAGRAPDLEAFGP